MKRLVIDTETTGLSPYQNKTLTVGMLFIEVEKDFLEIIDSNHIFIKHSDYNADPRALAVNKIDLENHNKIAIYPSKACDKINSFVDKNGLHQTKLLGHNIQFDKGFLNALFNQGKTIPKFHTESSDTMYFWNYLKKLGHVPYHLRSNLQTIADFFKVDYSKAHSALDDCHITAKVYHEMLKLKQ